jgi:hypothetical protein
MVDQAIGPCHLYAQHHPVPAKRVENWQQELEKILQRVPKQPAG